MQLELSSAKLLLCKRAAMRLQSLLKPLHISLQICMEKSVDINTTQLK